MVLAKVTPVLDKVKAKVGKVGKVQEARSGEKVEGDADDIKGLLEEQAEGIAEKMFKGGGGEAMDGEFTYVGPGGVLRRPSPQRFSFRGATIPLLFRRSHLPLTSTNLCSLRRDVICNDPDVGWWWKAPGDDSSCNILPAILLPGRPH